MTEDYTLSVQAPKPNYMLSFHRNELQVGFFDFNKGKMHFEGDVTESGKVFVDWVFNAFQERIDAAVAAEREACAKLCDEVNNEYGGEEVSASWIAAAIRARKNN